MTRGPAADREGRSAVRRVAQRSEQGVHVAFTSSVTIPLASSIAPNMFGVEGLGSGGAPQ